MVDRNTGDKKDEDKKKSQPPKIPVSKSSPTLTTRKSTISGSTVSILEMLHCTKISSMLTSPN